MIKYTNTNPVPLIRVEGSHIEIGKQIGEAFAEQIRHHIQNARTLIESSYESLELNWVQMKYVEKVFDREHQKRLEILKKEAGRSVRMDDLWQQLTDEREKKIEQILDEPQMRDYRLLTNPIRLIAKNR